MKCILRAEVSTFVTVSFLFLPGRCHVCTCNSETHVQCAMCMVHELSPVVHRVHNFAGERVRICKQPGKVICSGQNKWYALYVET